MSTIDESKEVVGFIGRRLKLTKEQVEFVNKRGYEMTKAELEGYRPEDLHRVYNEIIRDEKRVKNTLRALFVLDRMLWIEGKKNDHHFTEAAARLAHLHLKYVALKEAGHDV